MIAISVCDVIVWGRGVLWHLADPRRQIGNHSRIDAYRHASPRGGTANCGDSQCGMKTAK